MFNIACLNKILTKEQYIKKTILLEPLHYDTLFNLQGEIGLTLSFNRNYWQLKIKTKHWCNIMQHFLTYQYLIHQHLIDEVHMFESYIFLWITTYVADAVPLILMVSNTNGLSIFFIEGKPDFNNGPRSLPKNSPDYTILGNWVFGISIVADELFAKALRSLEICLLVSNNLCRKLVSLLELPNTFDERFKVTSVPIFISDFHLLSCKLDNFTFKVLFWVISYWYYIKAK